MLHICSKFTKEIPLNINTFIFDLGGVIIDLDEQATIQSFSKLSKIPEQDILDIVSNSHLFQDYEKGLVSDDVFRKGVNKAFGTTLSDAQIDTCWNAMLKSITIDRLNLLLSLKEKYKVIVLSNTNSIHIKAFNKILEKVSGKDSLTFFAHHVFFSHKLNMRKPDEEIYREILRLSASNPTESLFMDDKLENLRGAHKTGIQTMQINSPDEIFELKRYV